MDQGLWKRQSQGRGQGIGRIIYVDIEITKNIDRSSVGENDSWPTKIFTGTEGVV